MKNNKLYIPVDCAARHEDFDVWYEDGTVGMTFKSTNGWTAEKGRINVIGWRGGEIAHIKQDQNCVEHRLTVGRYEYTMNPIWIYRLYRIDGLCWSAKGTLRKMPLVFINDKTQLKDCQVHEVEFMDKGLCWEVKVRDLAKLRIAACAVVAIAEKEEFAGRSSGVNDPQANGIKRFRRWVNNKGYTADEVERMDESGELEALMHRVSRAEAKKAAKEARAAKS